MKIESKTGASPHPASRIYNFVSDFRNFNSFIPENTVSNWKAETESCSFSMSLLGNVALKIDEKEKDKLIRIVSDPSVSQYNFTLWIQIKELAENDSRIRIVMEPQLNQIMLSMAKGYLKTFVDSMVDEIEKFNFPDQ